MADFEQKGPQRGRTLKFFFTFSRILGKPKKCYYFLTQNDKNSVFLTPKFFQKVKITEGPSFLPRRPKFYSGLAEKFFQELSTWYTVRVLLKGTVTRDFLLLVFFHESVSPKPLIISLGPFRILSKIRGDIRSSKVHHRCR